MSPSVPLSRWRLTGPSLPERLIERERQAFSLPGAQALADFAALLDDESVPSSDRLPAQGEEKPSAPFRLPALLPEDMPGAAALSRELRLGGLSGDHAALHVDLLLGRGGVYLDDERVASFRDGPFSLDLTPALLSGRTHTLSFRFDATRPAGMLGGVLLRTARCARIRRAALVPHAASRTMTVRVAIQGLCAGNYLLRAQPCPPAGAAEGLAARDVSLRLAKGETRVVELTLSVPGERFVPGEPYAAPVVKLSLWQTRPALRPAASKRGFWRRKATPSSVPPRLRPGALCDAVPLMGGYPGDAPRAFVPLTARECLLPPDELVSRIRELHCPAVLLPVPAADLLARELTRAGVCALQKTPRDEQTRERLARFPCITLVDVPKRDDELSDEVSAWRLSSMTGAPRRLDPGLTPADLLCEAAGRELDPSADGTRAVLSWLRALSVRLCAEAARQGRVDGPLCAPGEWNQPDIAEALKTAFAPLHLSALPQRGAWWTRSRFSAVLHAFVPPGSVPEDSPETLLAEALLETDEGELLARLCIPCPLAGGEVGVLETTLPTVPCVLTLSSRLLLGDAVLEQSALPVYVGERGVLEAAFAS
ncbi:MAG: hypothetical protein Q4G52_04980 [Clostridia bacterium]|nr:hypothetical protein [Clostridia bacterium]